MKIRSKMLALLMSVSVAASMISATGTAVFADGETNEEQQQGEASGENEKKEVKYGEPVYSWEGKNCTATVKGTDGSKQVEKATASEQVTVPAGCETNGTLVYTVNFKNPIFKTQTKKAEIPAAGHSFGSASYSWNGTQCTAVRSCNTCGRTEEETVGASEEITVPAGSTTPGEMTYTAVFANGAFSAQTRTEEIEPTGEDEENAPAATVNESEELTPEENVSEQPKNGTENLGSSNDDSATPEYSISYEWKAKETTSGYTCTATRTRTDGQGQPETQQVDAVLDESRVKAPTCTEDGEEVYTADFSADFTDQAQLDAETGKVTSRVTVPALGHMYVQAKYNWTKTANGYACEASSVCENNPSHVLKENGTIDLKETKSPTCTEKGEMTYTATFTKQPFTTQQKKEEEEALGHLYVTASYSWKKTDKGYECTAKSICDNNKSHVLTETVTAEEKITKAPTCETEGTAVYAASFKNQVFKVQKKNVKLAAKGHNYGAVEYTWEKTDKGYQCTARRVCKNDSSHIQTETESAEYKETKAATTQAKGEGVYTVTFKNSAFEKQTKTIELPVITSKKTTSSGSQSAAANKSSQAASDSKQKSSVKTGDETQPLLPIVLGLGALAVIIGAGIKLRKKN